jgi:hypothetical protein
MPTNNQLVCEGCHKQFDKPNELQQHQQHCTQYQARKRQGGGSTETARGAGGHTSGGANRES